MESLAADHQSSYGFRFSVQQRNLQVEEQSDDEERLTYTTFRMNLWKKPDDESGPASYELASSRECRISQNEVTSREDWPISTLKSHLTELRILEGHQAEGIELVMERIRMEDVIGKRGVLVVMDIYEDCQVEEDVIDEEEEEEEGMVPASEAAIAGLDKVKVEEEEGNLCCCVICMEEDEDRFSRMPCAHVFHTRCVEQWLRISGSCPLCRRALPVED